MLSEGHLYSLFRETGEAFKVVTGPISEPEGEEKDRKMVLVCNLSITLL
jgi:hypothetical protein